MLNYHTIIKRVAAAAVLGAFAIAVSLEPAHAQSAGGAAAPQKNYKQGEYPMFEGTLKDLASNPAKAIADLDEWKSKFADSDYKDERSVLFIQAYTSNKNYDKALDEAGQLMSKDIDAAFPDPKDGPGWVIRALNFVCVAIQQVPNPTPQQIATAEKAAKLLQNYDRKPAALDAAAWNGAKADLQKMAKSALLYIAVAPANAALARQDCETAQTLLSKALQDNPDNAFVSYQLGQAYMCTVKKTPARNEEVRPKAIYEFIRTLVVDPSVAGTQNAQKMTEVLTGTYVNFHGGSDGLEELKQQAKASPLPPANFTIESSTKVSERKQAQFESQYPQLAMWLKIKGALAGGEGQKYFEEQLKNADLPKLKGTVIEGKPACRSKELVLAVPEPEQQNAQPVITLKLDAPLTGKPEAGEIEWKGVPSAFQPDPFMLTMDTEKANIANLKTSPCAATGARPAAKKGGAPRKK